jgi:O6-methylguanine-DNA--protein-cysteine methyltransferase
LHKKDGKKAKNTCLLQSFYVTIEFTRDSFPVSFIKGGKMKTFTDKVYELLKRVPKGRVTTYKELAHALDSKAYRGVGQALRTNPYAPEVP